MKTIWKFLVDKEVTYVNIPKGANILNVGVDPHSHLIPCFWAFVDPDAETETRKFLLVATGEPLDDNMGEELFYYGTVTIDEYAWHICEIGQS